MFCWALLAPLLWQFCSLYIWPPEVDDKHFSFQTVVFCWALWENGSAPWFRGFGPDGRAPEPPKTSSWDPSKRPPPQGSSHTGKGWRFGQREAQQCGCSHWWSLQTQGNTAAQFCPLVWTAQAPMWPSWGPFWSLHEMAQELQRGGVKHSFLSCHNTSRTCWTWASRDGEKLKYRLNRRQKYCTCSRGQHGWGFFKTSPGCHGGVRTPQSKNNSCSNYSKIGSLSLNLCNKACKIVSSYLLLKLSCENILKKWVEVMLMLFINVCFCSQSLLYIQTLKPTWTQQKSLFFMIVFVLNTECSNVLFGMEDVCSNPMIGGLGVSSWSGMRGNLNVQRTWWNQI